MPNPSSFRTTQQWHEWFTLQAQWTRPTRQWLYRQAGLSQGQDILEVGCGTGVIITELALEAQGRILGLDIDGGMLKMARRQPGPIHCLQGDAHELPFPDNSLDIVLCHYLLLWLDEPLRAVREMARIIKSSGVVLACAEPDYGGRIDHPPELVRLGRLQAEALRRQGADPDMGRKLGQLFCAAGLHTTVGVMAGGWQAPTRPDDGFSAEWDTRRRDLSSTLTGDELDRLEQVDREAMASGQRVLFVPTFYALGRKP